MKFNKKSRCLALALSFLASLCITAPTGQAVVINVNAGALTQADGVTPIPSNSVVMVIASTANTSFGALTNPTGASATAFVNEADDAILEQWGLDGAGGAGTTIHVIEFNLGETIGGQVINGGMKLMLAWYNLSNAGSPTAPGEGTQFGTYRSELGGEDGSAAWQVPAGNADDVALNMFTISAGGSVADAEGKADQVTEGEAATNQPPVAVCQNVTNAANGSCQASVTALQVDGGSSDPDGTIANRILTPAGPFSPGNTPVMLTVIDNNGASNSCNATVVVRDTTLPTITCPANVVTTLPSGQTSANVTFPAPTVSDNCSGVTSSSTPASGSLFSLGTNTVTSRAIDGSNNTNTCTFQVIVLAGVASNQPPVAMCRPITNSANGSCQAVVAATDVDNGSFDSDGTITNRTLTPAGPFSLGTTAVTLTVFDNKGASNSCSTTVTVRDTTLPTITCPSNIITSLPPGQTSTAINYPAPQASDLCSSVTVTSLPPSGATFPLGTNIVTSRAIDGANNTNTCTFQIILLAGSASNQPPVAMCRPITNSANGSCQASVTALQVDNGSFDPDGTITNRILTPAGPFSLGTTSVTLTVFDDKGSSNSCSATVTVRDTTAPSITCPTTVITSLPPGQTSAVVSFNPPVANDSCSGVTTSSQPPSGSTFPLGTNTVTSRAIDGANNTNTCTFQVIVLAGAAGNQPPVAVCRSVTNSAGANCQATFTAANVDGGSSDPDGSIANRILTPAGPFSLGSTDVTLTIIDNQGASNSCSTVVVVVDRTAPAINCPAIVITQVPSGTTSAVVTYPTPTASDNCSSATVTSTPPSGSTFPLGSNVVTVSAFDQAGNTNTCTFAVIVRTASECTDINALCTRISTLDLPHGHATAIQKHCRNVQRSFENGNLKAAASQLDSLIKLIQKFQANGIIDDATAQSLIDCAQDLMPNTGNDPPVASCHDVTEFAGTNCKANVIPAEIDNGSFDPNGDSLSFSLSPKGSYPLGDTTVTLTVTDRKGASTTCTATVSVVDASAPSLVCPGGAVVRANEGQTSAIVNYPTPSAKDPCSSVTLNCVPPSGSSFPIGTNTVSCTATDTAGNTNTCSFQVVVLGANGSSNQSPVAKTTNVTVNADGNCQGNVTPQQVDNGSFDPDGNIASRSLNPPGPYPVGTTTVTLTVVDNLGGNNSAPATVTVLDKTAPSITCPADLVTAAPQGQSFVAVNFPTPNASDSCSAVTVTCMPPSGSIFPVATNLVTCMAIDIASNTNNCTFKVIVQGTSAPNQSPVAKGKNVTVPADGNCQGTATPAQADDGSFDPDGSIASRSLNPTGPYPMGTTPVTFIVVDTLGASNSVPISVTVQDSTAPTITCPTNIVVIAAQGQNTAVVDFPLPIGDDTCSGVNVTSSRPSGSLFPLGNTPVIFTAVDGRGNTNTCSITIEVKAFGSVVCDTIPGLIARVETIPVTRTFTLGQRTSMIKKLQAAQRSIDRDRFYSASLQYDGFIRNCRILRDFHRIERQIADELILCAYINKAHLFDNL